jgi:hypothetical protein
MQTLPEADIGKSWDDPSYTEAILKKGQRRPRQSTPTSDIADEQRPMVCSNCGNPVAVSHLDRCRCSIWNVGRKVGTTQ